MVEIEIPHNFDYQSMSGLSNELKNKLLAQRPLNIAQASRVEGMTPAALFLILSKVVSADTAAPTALTAKSTAIVSPNFRTEVIIVFILLSFEFCGFY